MKFAHILVIEMKTDFSIKKIEYVCPGCLFFKEKNILEFNNIFNCNICSKLELLSNNKKEILIFKTFAIHNKHGYRCDDCKRFIPHPIDNSINIQCVKPVEFIKIFLAHI